MNVLDFVQILFAKVVELFFVSGNTLDSALAINVNSLISYLLLSLVLFNRLF